MLNSIIYLNSSSSNYNVNKRDPAANANTAANISMAGSARTSSHNDNDSCVVRNTFLNHYIFLPINVKLVHSIVCMLFIYNPINSVRRITQQTRKAYVKNRF